MVFLNRNTSDLFTAFRVFHQGMSGSVGVLSKCRLPKWHGAEESSGGNTPTHPAASEVDRVARCPGGAEWIS